MIKDRRIIEWPVRTVLVLGLIVYAWRHDARGQATPPTLPEPINLGRSPGSLETSEFAPPGAEIIGGRRRGGVIPRKAARPPRTAESVTLNGPSVMQVPSARITPGGVSAASPGALPEGKDREDEGPADGLTLDAAIARLLAANLDLQALKEELPQAEADVLTAGLRANPLLYADTQFIPYGANNPSRRPIGPTQYDVMITYPIDVSLKRRARVLAACAARSVIQAQYQDAVRRQIANLYKAYVDLQSARQTYLSARGAVREQELLASQLQRLGAKAKGDPHRLAVEFQKTQSALADAADALEDARESLALLLNIPPDLAAGVEIRGRLHVESPPPPPLDELIRIALRYRPDLAATRLGVNRADAEIHLAEANRLDDVFFFYDPLSYQDNRPSHLASGRSWDVGITIPLPIYNRNQGNISRARTNARQSRLELAALERRVVAEVRLAEREYRSARESLDRFERTILPSARASRDRTVSQFLAGTIDIDEYLGQLNEAQESAQLYRESLVRKRRSMLDLNTAVGLRLMP